MKPIYLEPDEEITSVIDKINAAGHQNLALVVAKNSTLLQSLINLKLLAKEAKAKNIEIAIITANKVGQRLARQVGLPIFSNLGAAGSIANAQAGKTPTPKPALTPSEPEELIDGVPIHQYTPAVTGGSAEPAEEVEPEPVAEEQPASTEPELPESEETEPEPEEPTEEHEPSHFEKPNRDHLPPVVSRALRMPSGPREPMVIPWKAIIIAVVLLLITGVVGFIFIPKATVTLTLPATKISKDAQLAIKTNVTTAEAEVLPGNLLEVDKTGTKTITSTGKKDIGTKAAGSVTLYNKASSSAVSLAAGTTIVTSGKTYTLDKAVTIPGATVSGGSVVAGQVSVNVTASAVGDTFNVSNVQFTVTGQPALVYASGSVTGGTTKQVTILSQTDIDTALTAVRDEMLAQAKTELKAKATNQNLLEAAIWRSNDKETVDQAVNAQVDTATATVSYHFSVITFDTAQVTAKLTELLSAGLAADQELVIPTGQEPVITFGSLSEDKTTLNLKVTGNGFAVTKIDKKALAQNVKNKSVSQATTYLQENQKADKVEIKISPSWWISRLPMLAGKISIEHGFTEATEAPPTTTEGVTP